MCVDVKDLELGTHVIGLEIDAGLCWQREVDVGVCDGCFRGMLWCMEESRADMCLPLTLHHALMPGMD